MTLEACDPIIFTKGTQVFVTHTIPFEQMNAWVEKVAERSGQPVDWHSACGYNRVLALGDLDAVHRAIEELMPEHDRLREAAVQAVWDSIGQEPPMS